jgi:hypothetical protein
MFQLASIALTARLSFTAKQSVHNALVKQALAAEMFVGSIHEE